MAGLTQWLTLALLVQSGLPGLAGRSVQRPRASQQGQAGESCTTGQDLIVQALEKLNPNSPVSAVQDANRSMQRATDLCAESGTAWYYRSLLESRLQHKPQADYAMRQAMLFPSDALRDQLNPFVLAAPPGKGKPPARIRERWALVVGIGDFADKRIGKLAYTTADATAMRDVLVDPKLGGFRPENVRLLTDAGASLADIKMGINWLARSAAPEDLVVVYVASHGSPRRVDTAGATYILTHDTAIDPSDVDPDALYASALPMVEFADAVATRLRSLRTAIFLDTCYSGGAMKESNALDKAAVSRATLDRLSQGAGRVIFAASRTDQESLESKQLQHGYFTYYLVEALRSHPEMPLSKVFRYVEQHVSQRVDTDFALYGRHQTPVLSQSSDDADFPLGVEIASTVAMR